MKSSNRNQLTRALARRVEDILLSLSKDPDFAGSTRALLASHIASQLKHPITISNVEGAAHALGIVLPGSRSIRRVSDRDRITKLEADVSILMQRTQSLFPN